MTRTGPPGGPVTVPLQCPFCGGPVTVQMADWDPRGASWRAAWPCPYCGKENEGEFPGRVVWVTKGHDPESSA